MKTNLKLIRFLIGALSWAVIVSGCGGGGGSDSQTINTPPQISGVAAPFVKATTQYDFKPTASDTNGDVLTFSVKNLPAWASFDSNTGEITGQPDDTYVGQYPDVTISVSDGTDTVSMAPFAIDVLNPPLTKQSIGTDNATVTPTADGFGATGDVSVTSGSNTTDLKNADLQFKFDAGDNLSSVTGTADLPASISDYLLIPNPLTVKVGLYTGAQINADPDIGVDSTGGIRLVDNNQYLVFFIGASLNITVQNKNNSSQVPVTLGLGDAQSLIIMDPTDPFSYVFGYQNGLGFGTGYSQHGLIPYVPKFADSGSDAFPQLDSFYGNEVDKGVFPIGIKVFDLFSLTATRVIHNPNLSDIDWTNPMDSSLHYQAGYNGSADFNFGVLGIGLFSYHLADMSATIDVGLQRQHLAVQGVYEPTESSQPIWLPARPSPVPTDKLVANLSFDPVSGIAMDLRGVYQSDFPQANLNGSMHLDQNGLTLNGIIDDASNPITVSASADATGFNAMVKYKVDINAGLQTQVLDEMDSISGEVQSAINDYTNAVSGYNLAVSLDGLRAQLPTIADTAITALNKIPGSVYSSVHKSVVDYINAGKYCVTSLGPCYAYKDYVNATSVANTAASAAQSDASSTIAPYVTALNAMKTHAAEVDDATLRAQLKASLLDVYSRQTIVKTISYTYSKKIDYGVGSFTISKTFSYSINQTVIPPADAALIKTAADNVDTIPGAYTVMIDTQTIVDSLPVESAISQAKQDVQNGLRQVPSFDGAGYSVSSSGSQSAYIVLSGQKQVVQFNLLDPVNAAADIIRAITNTVIAN